MGISDFQPVMDLGKYDIGCQTVVFGIFNFGIVLRSGRGHQTIDIGVKFHWPDHLAFCQFGIQSGIILVPMALKV